MSDAAFTFRVDEELKKQFISAARERDRSGAQLLREFMLEYVQQQQSCASDALEFRQKVEAGLASANAGKLIPAQDVEARFAATRDAL
jgi:predicted transcriptional regulator